VPQRVDATLQLKYTIPIEDTLFVYIRADSADAWEYRQDRGELLAPVRLPNGTLLVEGFAAREGVLEYRRADGSVRRELVTTEVLRASLGTLGRAPVTLEHPHADRYPDGVTPQNVRDLGVGDTDGTVSLEAGGFVRVQLAVRRDDAIEAVQAGKRELSPGYGVKLGPGGVHPVYGRYDAEQLERVYNHLAIVDRARGGAEVRLRADSAVATTVIRLDAPAVPASTPSGASRPQESRVNPKFLRLLTLLGVTSRVDSDDGAIEAACAMLDQRKDAADRSATEHKAAIDKLTAERDTEKTRADTAEARVRELEQAEVTRADAAARTELEATAKALGLKPEQHADSKALRRAIATAHLGAEVKADASDDYIRALCDLAKGRVDGGDRDDGLDAGRRAWEPPPARRDDDNRGGGGVRKDSRQRYLEAIGVGGVR
jgi:hypothetical protein